MEWENTPITGQIQVTKTSADYNSMNGWPAGTPIPNTEFEIYNARTGRLVDTIRTDKNGVAVSKPLPLARYKIVESKAADFYGLDKTPIEVEIEHEGQIVKAAMTNRSLYTNVNIKKTGYVEVMPGQQIRYDLSGIANNSTTSLTSFYWRDTLPTQAVRLDKLVTGPTMCLVITRWSTRPTSAGRLGVSWRITSPPSSSMCWTRLPLRWGWPPTSM